MKLNVFNKENAKCVRDSGSPSVRIGVKTGLFTFNSAFAERLNLKIGDALIICQDDDRKKDWYVACVEAKNGFEVRAKDDQKSFTFNSVKTAKELAKAIGFENACTFLVAKNPTVVEGIAYFAIITINQLNKK